MSEIRRRDPSNEPVRGGNQPRQTEREHERQEHGSIVPDWLGPILFLPASPKPMAHRDPHVAEMARHMARPERRSPLNALISLFTSPASRTGKSFFSGEPRRREALAVLFLVAVASVISIAGPMARAGAAPPSSSDSGPVVDVATDPADNPAYEPVDPLQPTAEPTATPAPTRLATTKRPAPTKKPTPKPVKVRTFVALGDSLTAWPAGDPWPSRLDAIDPALRLIKNAGVPGDTTAQMRARFNSDVLPYNPAVVFILGGTNDLGLGISGSTTIANLRAIVVAAKARKITPILLLVPPDSYSNMASRINSLNAAIINLANSQRVVYVDIHTPLTNSYGVYYPKYTVDGLHFSDLGAQVVANTVRVRIRRYGL